MPAELAATYATQGFILGLAVGAGAALLAVGLLRLLRGRPLW